MKLQFTNRDKVQRLHGQPKLDNKCWVCDGQGGSQTEECLHCKGTGDLAKGTPEAISEVQTWPWDTIILMSTTTGKDTILGTDIEVIYDREAKVYRRK